MIIISHAALVCVQCSLMTCERDPSRNRAVVSSFDELIRRSNGSIDCFYDPWFSDYGAVLRLETPRNDVIYAVLIPALSLFLAINVCLVFCKWCRAKEKLNTTTAATAAGKHMTSSKSRDTAKDDDNEASMPLKHSKEKYKRAVTV